jgi:DNA-binding LacI/PurR family transcriptional regulator
MTLKDIAEQVGVSISTVSRVINKSGTKVASNEVKQKIWKVVRESGYVPNEAARMLQNCTDTDTEDDEVCKKIYVMVLRSLDEVEGDTFFTQIIDSIENTIYKKGYVIERIFQRNDLNSTIFENNSECYKNRYLITIGRFEPALLDHLNFYFSKIICVSLNDLDINCDQVFCNGYLASQTAINYLAKLGHEKIAFIGEEKEGRYRGYIQGLENNKLHIFPNYIVKDAIISMNGGKNAMKRILMNTCELPTAVFCSNDRTAIGALRACKDQNVNVPKDISIIGINDIEATQFVDPMLTTVRVPLNEMGKVAVNTLVDNIEHGHTLAQKIALPFNLIKRESCKKYERID